MNGLLRRFWDQEVAPVIAGVDAQLAFVAVVGTAALINKRYLGDSSIIGPVETRWLALLGWMLASALLLAVVRRWPGRAWPAVAAGIGGVAIMLGLLSLGNFGLPGASHLLPFWTSPAASTAAVMLVLVWLPVVSAVAALAAHVELPPRAPVLAWVPAAALLVTLLVLSGRGPLRLVLLDPRWDKTNWCGTTFCWLVGGTLLPTLALLGPNPEREGLGWGRWRFWVPWVAVLLVVMVVLIAAYAGRQPAFTAYYPMYKQDWFGYLPTRDGWSFVVVYEFGYLLYFLGWEYLFRGWMLFRLEPLLGAGAIAVQTMPFVLMHIGKPGPELHSSLVAGIVLGWLAWRSRSALPCFILHWAAACTMDLVAVWHQIHPMVMPQGPLAPLR